MWFFYIILVYLITVRKHSFTCKGMLLSKVKIAERPASGKELLIRFTIYAYCPCILSNCIFSCLPYFDFEGGIWF